jgi:hypothetical protein
MSSLAGYQSELSQYSDGNVVQYTTKCEPLFR